MQVMFLFLPPQIAAKVRRLSLSASCRRTELKIYDYQLAFFTPGI
jgi:hypothetical protein